MKNNILDIIPFVTLLFLSCGNQGDSKTENKKSRANKVVEVVKNSQENGEPLVNQKHLTKEQFASWLPETLLGMPLNSSTINMLPEIGSCGANYSVKNRSVRIMIIDGAGEKGNDAVSTYRMSSTMEYDDKGSWGTTKTKTINGLKVKESYLKDDKYNLSLFYDNRFAVDIQTREVFHEELEQLLKELRLEQLH